MFRKLWLLILLLQTVQIFARNPGNYRRYRKYRYGKYSSPRRQSTAMSLYPRCRTESTDLNILVLDEAGKPIGRSKLWYVSARGMKEHWTANNGHARVSVSGCEVGVIAWYKDKQSKYQSVNLEACKDRTEKVVIQLSVACNFMIRAVNPSNTEGNPNIVGQKSDMISFVAHSGGSSTSGSFVGGAEASPACITVKNGDNLKVVVTTQSSELPNIVSLSNVEEGTDALVTVPYPIKAIEQQDKNAETDPTRLTTDYSLMVITNVWEYDGGAPNASPTGLSNGNLIPLIGIGLSSTRPLKADGVFTTAQIDEDLDKSAVYIVYVILDIWITDYIKGNAVLYDRKGNMKVIEYPTGTPHAIDSYWILGCMRDCLDTFKEKSVVVTIAELPTDSNTFCDLDNYSSYV